MYNIYHISIGSNPGVVTAFVHRNKRGGDPNPCRYYFALFRVDKPRAARRMKRLYAILDALMKQHCGG